jgi:hypothetical protein
VVVLVSVVGVVSEVEVSGVVVSDVEVSGVVVSDVDVTGVEVVDVAVVDVYGLDEDEEPYGSYWPTAVAADATEGVISAAASRAVAVAADNAHFRPLTARRSPLKG